MKRRNWLIVLIPVATACGVSGNIGGPDGDANATHDGDATSAADSSFGNDGSSVGDGISRPDGALTDAPAHDQAVSDVSVPDVISAPVCGDHHCDASETCASCTSDCGACANVCAGAVNGPPDYSRDMTGTTAAGSDANQLAALIRANHWRTPGGLTPLNANANIQHASVSHAHFMSVNPAACYPGSHQEVMTSGSTTCVGFTGTQPWDRMTAAGYTWRAASEVIDTSTTGADAVDQWIWTVYHRVPFLDATYQDVGFALEGGHAVMDFGASSRGSATTQIVFPLPGQTGVKRDFNGSNEGPTPLPPSTTHWPSGTVISVSFTGAYTISDHQIYDSQCNPVAHTAHGEFDDTTLSGNQTHFFYMFSNVPLAAATRYTASVSAMIGGTAWSKTWSFTTQ